MARERRPQASPPSHALKETLRRAETGAAEASPSPICHARFMIRLSCKAMNG
jgi:hypothetical protein